MIVRGLDIVIKVQQTLQIPVVVDPEGYNGFDLLTPNEACFESEVSHFIIF